MGLFIVGVISGVEEGSWLLISNTSVYRTKGQQFENKEYFEKCEYDKDEEEKRRSLGDEVSFRVFLLFPINHHLLSQTNFCP